MTEAGHISSYWHDIPLDNGDGTVNFVCEIPKETQAKMEVATVSIDITMNPIQQYVERVMTAWSSIHISGIHNRNWVYSFSRLPRHLQHFHPSKDKQRLPETLWDEVEESLAALQYDLLQHCSSYATLMSLVHFDHERSDSICNRNHTWWFSAERGQYSNQAGHQEGQAPGLPLQYQMELWHAAKNLGGSWAQEWWPWWYLGETIAAIHPCDSAFLKFSLFSPLSMFTCIWSLTSTCGQGCGWVSCTHEAEIQECNHVV